MKISNIQIETQRLLLKPISLDYKDDIFQEFTPEITIYLFSKAPDRIEETIEFIEGAIKKNNEGKAFQAVILDKSTGEFLGCAGLHRIDTQTPELGIWIKKSAHGNAFGEETIFALKKDDITMHIIVDIVVNSDILIMLLIVLTNNLTTVDK